MEDAAADEAFVAFAAFPAGFFTPARAAPRGGMRAQASSGGSRVARMVSGRRAQDVPAAQARERRLRRSGARRYYSAKTAFLILQRQDGVFAALNSRTRDLVVTLPFLLVTAGGQPHLLARHAAG